MKKKKLSDTMSIDEQDGVVILSIQHNLGYDTAGDLRRAYNDITQKQLLVDLGGVTITTSRGMATLLAIILEAQDKGQRVYLCHVSAPCMNIINAMDIMTHVPGLRILDSVEEGLALFRQGG